MEEALQSGRGAIDWQRQLLAHYCNGEIDIPYAAQNVGNKVTILEALRVPPMSYFIVSGTDVIEYRSRQPSLRQKPKVMKVVTIAQSHGTQANTPRFGQSKQKFCCLPRLRSALTSRQFARILTEQHLAGRRGQAHAQCQRLRHPH
jgi:hypothetical protein